MPSYSVLLVIGEDNQYKEAEKIRSVLEGKLTIKFRVEELEDIGDDIKAPVFKKVVSKVKAVILISSENFTRCIDQKQLISFDADGSDVTLEGTAIPDCLDDPTLRKKFILISFGGPAHKPIKLQNMDSNDVFIFTKNLNGVELQNALKDVAVRISSK